MFRRFPAIGFAVASAVVLQLASLLGAEAQEPTEFWISSAAHDPRGTVAVEFAGPGAYLVETEVLTATVGGKPLGSGTRTTEESVGGLVVLLFETSSSMQFGKLEEARAAATRLLEELGAGHRVAVVTFDDGARVVSSPTFDRATTAAAIESLSLGSQAGLYAGVAEAAELLAGESTPGALVILGWGWEFWGVGVDRASSLAAARELGAPVFWTSVGANFDRPYFEELTAESGGRIVTPEDLPTIAAELPAAATTVEVEFEAPTLPLGRQLLRVAGPRGTISTTLEISNDGLLEVASLGQESANAPFELALDTKLPLASFAIEAETGADPVPVARSDEGIRIDPWDLPAGQQTLTVGLSTDGELVSTAEARLNVPQLEPLLQIDRADDEAVITWRVQGEPGAQLKVLVDDELLVSSDDSEVRAPVGADATLTLEVVARTGEIVASTVAPGASGRAGDGKAASVSSLSTGMLVLAVGGLALVGVAVALRLGVARRRRASEVDQPLLAERSDPRSGPATTATRDPWAGVPSWPRRAIAIRQPDGREWCYPVRAPVISIGSAATCDVRLPPGAARARHLRLAAASDYTYEVLAEGPVTLVQTGAEAAAGTVITVREWIAVGDHHVAVEHW